ncbi:MAG: FliM/FliN family flagellar motor C-terminal domain-containing protein [Candidatus Sedimenticola sp. (ex Thyasira tokunagai)]
MKHSEIGVLKDSLDQIITHWCNEWLPTDVNTSEVNVEVIKSVNYHYEESFAKYLSAWSNDTWAALSFEPEVFPLLGNILLGHDADRITNSNSRDIPVGMILQSVVDDALLDLSERIVAGGDTALDAIPVKHSRNVAIPIDSARPWSGAVVVNLKISTLSIRLMLSSSLVENFVPHQTPHIFTKPIGIEVALEGIEEHTIETEVRLESATLSIGALAKLSSGDVVVLDHPLEAPFKLVFKGSDKHCTGYLGRCDGKYALKLDSMINIDNT